MNPNMRSNSPQPLSYNQDLKMRKFHSERFTQSELEEVGYDVDTGNSAAYYWHYTVGDTKYTQRLDRAKGTITITPFKETIKL